MTKKILLLAVTALYIAGCNGSGGGDSGGGGTTPTPTPTPIESLCNDTNALNKGFTLPCICKGGYTVASDGKSCTSNGGGGNNGGNVVRPANIFYASNPISYIVGAAILSPVAPSVDNCSGNICSWNVSPALPSGLSINSLTGAINGTANVTAIAKNYTITASNSAGQATVSLNLAVINRPPTGLSISANNQTYPIGTMIPQNAVSYTSEYGSVTSMSISPSLPNGLNFATYTANQWAITGTPTVASPLTEYTITASGPSGSATLKVSLATAAAPTGFVYNQSSPSCNIISGVYTCDFRYREQFASIFPVVATGNNLTYELVSVNGITASSNSLISGVSVSGSSGAIFTTTFGPMETSVSACGGVNAYCTAVIKVSNGLGSTTTQIKFRVYADAASIRYASNAYTLRILRSVEDVGYNTLGSIEAIQVGGDITCHGTFGCYSISPALPSGLNFSSNNGKISGSPAFNQKQVAKSYTVTAVGDNNSVKPTATFTIEIKERLPPTFYYTSGGAYTFKKNLSMELIPEVDTTRLPGVCTTYDNIYPENPPIPINSFTISPALPSGLSLNTSAMSSCEPQPAKGGMISGTATVYSPKTIYTISACNDGGCTSTTITLEVSPEFTTVVTGERHSCGIISEYNGSSRTNKVACWGANDKNQLGTSTSETCTIAGEGSIPCSTTPIIVNVGGGTLKNIVVGKNHTCITTDINPGDNNVNDYHSIFCWGDNSYGQLGNGVTGTSQSGLNAPQYGNSSTITDSSPIISAGGNATCFIRAELDDTGKVYCFGENYGTRAVQIGTSAQPVNQLYAEGLVVGSNHACAVKVDVSAGSGSDYVVTKDANSGKVVCWGKNDTNQLGLGTSSAAAFTVAPTQVKVDSTNPLNKVTQLAAGDGHVCALQDSEFPSTSSPSAAKYVYCWGANDVGQVGTGGISTSVGYAGKVVGSSGSGTLANVKRIGSGAKQTYISTLENSTDTFYRINILGKFPVAGSPYTGASSAVPVMLQQISGSSYVGFQAADVSPMSGPASANHGCVISSRNFVSCFGKNEAGQLGLGTTTDTVTPVQLRYLLP